MSEYDAMIAARNRAAEENKGLVRKIIEATIRLGIHRPNEARG